jgi:hypothetical protein
MVPAGEEAKGIIYEPNLEEELDLKDALKKASGKYHIADFDIENAAERIGDLITHLIRVPDRGQFYSNS